MENILRHCHSLECGGHFGGDKTTTKVCNRDFFCQPCTRILMPLCLPMINVRGWGNVSKRDEFPLKGILKVELFNV